MTQIGILSDSHGRADTTRLAVAALKKAGATQLLHLGDVCGEAVLDELVGHNARVVFGNCDFDTASLGRYCELIGIGVDHPTGELIVDDKRIVYTHGDREQEMLRAVEMGADYLLHGHSHELRDEHIASTRVINPGALFRAARYTAAVLDPAIDSLQIIEIPKTC